MNQILELSDKNFKAIIIKLIEQVITNSFEKIREPYWKDSIVEWI